MPENPDTLAAVIEAIQQIGGIPAVEPDQDFYDAGFTSVQALPLLMELETRFAISIPDERFIAARSARGLHQMILEIKEA